MTTSGKLGRSTWQQVSELGSVEAKVEVQYQCNFKDYVEALGAHVKRSVGYYFLWVAASLCLFFAAIEVLTGRLPIAVPFLLLGAFLLGYPLVVLPVVFPLWAKRDFRKHPNLSRVYSLKVDDEGLRMTSDLSQSEEKWPGYTRFVETPNLFTLYCGARIFYMIPKRAFSGLQVHEFRELLCRKLPSK